MDNIHKSDKEESGNDDDNLENFMTIDSVGDVDGKLKFSFTWIVSVLPEYHTPCDFGRQTRHTVIPEFRKHYNLLKCNVYQLFSGNSHPYFNTLRLTFL